MELIITIFSGTDTFDRPTNDMQGRVFHVYNFHRFSALVEYSSWNNQFRGKGPCNTTDIL